MYCRLYHPPRIPWSSPYLKRQLTPPFHPRPSRFSTTHHLEAGPAPTNHYDVLKLSPNCTHAELKKQFYVLSKETHPDRNRNDPTASERFSQISESYSVLADPEKRKCYDRDVLRYEQSRSHRGAGGGGASFAGSRPASGLSKRRGTFRGPPPSFYAHGNPSSSSAHQAQANAQSSGGATDPGPAAGQQGTFHGTSYADFQNEFDPMSTFKTQTHEDTRRSARMKSRTDAMKAELEALSDNDFWVRFAVVSIVLVGGITVGTLIAGIGSPKGGMTRSDGSRRDAGTASASQKAKQ